MKKIIGNILEVKAPAIIVHQVNCKGVAGAGLALAIRKKWPDWHKHYQFNPPSLGAIDQYEVEPGIEVCSFYAQDSFGQGLQTNYDAFLLCLKRLRLALAEKRNPTTVFFPYKIGCGLAGGDWDIVSQFIEDEFPEAVIVELPKRKNQ